MGCFLGVYRRSLGLGTQLLALTLTLGLAACGGGGKEAEPDPDPVPSGPAAVTEAPRPAETTLKISFVNASDHSAIDAGTLVLLEDKGGILDSAERTFTVSGGTLSLGIKESLLTDANKDGLLDGPARFKFSVKSEGYLPTVVEVSLFKVGINDRPIRLVSKATPPAGVAVEEKTVNLATAPAPITVAATAPTGATAAQLTLPPGTEFLSETGERLDNSTLSVLVAGYDAGNAESLSIFPGGLTATIENPGQLAVDEGSAVTSPDIRFISGGFVTLQLQDASGKVAKRISNGQSVTVRIAVTPGVINPETEKPVAVGDVIPYWSLDPESGTWRYDGMLNIRSDENGLYGEFETSHFSWFNLDWWYYRAGDERCDEVRISVVNESGATEQTRGPRPLVTANGLSEGGYGAEYQGDGLIEFYSAPADPATLSFHRGSTGKTFEIVRMVSGPSRATVGRVVDGVLHDVGLCSLQNPVLTVKAVTDGKPVFAAYSGSVPEGNGGSTPLVFYGYLDSPAETTVTVNYSVQSGTATAGSDFTGTSGTLTFAPGETFKPFTVTNIVGDTSYESDEYLSVSFTSTTATVDSWAQTQYGYILNDDLPELIFTADTVQEGNTTARIRARFAEPITGWTYLYLTPSTESTATPYADYLPGSENWAFYYYWSNSDQELASITVLDDKDVENTEELVYDVHVYPDYLSLPAGQRKVRIRINDDGDAIVSGVPEAVVASPGQAPAASITVEESAGTLWQQVRLSHASATPVSVTLDTNAGTASEGADYGGVHQTVSFAPGEATKVVPVAIYDDLDSEGLANETFALSLSAPSNATLATTNPVTVGIADNDVPYLYGGGWLYENDDWGGAAYSYSYLYAFPTASYPITLTIDSDTAGRAQISGLPKTVTIPAFQSYVPLNLTAFDDNTTEGYQYFTLNGSVTSGGAKLFYESFYGSAYAGVLGWIGISDSDPPPYVTISAANDNVADEGASLQFGLTLSKSWPQALSIRLFQSPGDDRVQLPQTVTIPAGQTFVNFGVPITNDTRFQRATEVCVWVDSSNDYWTTWWPACGTIRASDVTGGTGGSS